MEYLHCDVMDGHFVPNWMLFPDLINRIAAVSSLPLDVHLMIDEPARILPSLALRPGDIVSLHAESTHHLQRALAAVRAQGRLARPRPQSRHAALHGRRSAARL